MKFWEARYIVPGWIFAGTIIILLRNILPIDIQDYNILISVLVGIASGLPSGLLISSIFDIIWRQFLGEGKKFINYEYFREELSKSVKDRLALLKKDTSSDSDVIYMLNTLQERLGNRDIRNRVFFAIVWDSISPRRLQERSHRRLETFHTCCGSILSFFLGFIVSISVYVFVLYKPIYELRTFLLNNCVALLAIIFFIFVLSINAFILLKQVSQHENTWMRMVIGHYRNTPENLIRRSLLENTD